MSQSTETQVRSILESKDAAKQNIDRLILVAENLLKSSNINDIKTMISMLLADDNFQQFARPILLQLSNSTLKLSSDSYEEVANFVLNSLRQSNGFFDEVVYIFRDTLYKQYSTEGKYRAAAMVLAGLNLESSTKIYTVEEKANICITVAETFLADDESSAEQAEIYAQKAGALMTNISTTAEGRLLTLRYQSAHARVMDAHRKFVEAAMRYYELSTISQEIVDLLNLNEQDLLELFGKSVTCVILGKAGPQRSRVLGVLYKDDRLSQLDSTEKYSSHSAVLTKMYTQQLLRPNDLLAFEISLAVHQKALTADGFTIPEKAVIEHNLVATGKLYDNINFSELATILRLDARKAEKVAAKMISDGVLKAIIDQSDGILLFDKSETDLMSWDSRIGDICSALSDVVKIIEGTQ